MLQTAMHQRIVARQTDAFLLLCYKTNNAGDEIQSIAARQHLPRVDAYVDRDNDIDRYAGRDAKLVSNGWWCNRPDSFPFARPIKPLLISMHITERTIATWKRPDIKDYLCEHGPVGCRDHTTLRRLESIGVPCYFSGCMTLTFPRYEGPRSNQVLFVDPFGPRGIDYWPGPRDRGFPNELWNAVPQDIRRTSRYISQKFRIPIRAARFWWAQRLLRQYRDARLVVTSRLHCALPCVAMGTPVVFINANNDADRFSGLSDYFPRMLKLDQVRDGDWGFDWNKPQSLVVLSDVVARLANPIRENVQRFVTNDVRLKS